MNSLSKINLHLFDGEGEVDSGDFSVDAAQDSGEENTVDAEQETTNNSSDQATPAERTYTQKEVDRIIRGRLKGARDNENRLAELKPFLDKVGAKYGKDPRDIAGITEAFDKDDAYWEQAALDDGLTVEQKKRMASLEWEKAQRDREAAEATKAANVQKYVDQWQKQGQETKSIYPSFDFESEMDNDLFTTLLKANVDVKTAYEVIHRDEIISGAMKYTANKVREGITNNIQARASRPAENGSTSQATASIKIDPSKLTLKQMEDMEKRAARGERISFGP